MLVKVTEVCLLIARLAHGLKGQLSKHVLSCIKDGNDRED